MKRILSLDGGGIRGIFTLQILSRIEALFRQETGRPELCLADVFDLIAGTSTGAIIASLLSWGESVEDIERLYLESGSLMFRPANGIRYWWHSKYRVDEIASVFKSKFREDDGTPALMGSKRLKTLLLVMMRNATTGAPWPVSNNPNSHYCDRSRTDCNLNVPLWQLVRASTAAPTFYPPERIEFGHQSFLFVDGAMTPFNNPALAAILAATLPQYRMCWPTGRDKLHVISVGTGYERSHLPDKDAESIHLLDQLTCSLPAFIGDSAIEQDLLCRIMGDCIFGAPLDRELGDLSGPTLFPPREQKFSYVRYNQAFNTVPDSGENCAVDMRLDRIRNIPTFQALGRKYAAANVKREHLFPKTPNTAVGSTVGGDHVQ